MCTYISVALPKSAKLDACRIEFSSKRLALDQMDPSGHPKGLLATENYFFTCTGMCDCGTMLGSARCAFANRLENKPDVIAAKLRKQGWSEKKIQRRLDDLKKAIAKSKRRSDGLHDHFSRELENWIELIRSLLDRRLTEYVGVTVNDYGGPVNAPDFVLKRSEIDRHALDFKTLEVLERATLLIVR